MSIINDALKKVQANMEQKNSIPFNKSTPPPPSQNPSGDFTQNRNQFTNAQVIPPAPSLSSIQKPARPRIKQTILWSSVAFIWIILIPAMMLFFKKGNLKFPAVRLSSTTGSAKTVKKSSPKKIKSIINPVTLMQKKEDDALKLTGILAMNNGRVALINSEIYEVGDTIKGARVSKIADDYVEIVKDGQLGILKIRR